QSRLGLSLSGPRLSGARSARRGASPGRSRGRLLFISTRVRGPCSPPPRRHATHPDRVDPESAEAHYRQALALAEPRGMRPLVAHCHLGLGKLSRRTAQHRRAEEHLTTATTMYREMGMTYWLERAEAEIEGQPKQ